MRMEVARDTRTREKAHDTAHERAHEKVRETAHEKAPLCGGAHVVPPNTKHVHFSDIRLTRQFGKKTRLLIGKDQVESATTRNTDPQ
jgi:hypothetical protein